MNKLSKAFFLISAAVITACAACAEDTDAFKTGSSVFSSGFGGQKQVTDAEFQKTVQQLKDRSMTKKQKRIKEQVQPNSPAYDNEHLKMFSDSKEQGSSLSLTHTVMIPVKAYTRDGNFVQPGYYKLSCREIEKNSYVLDLAQGSQLILTVPAFQTEEDLEQNSIQFCSAEILPDGKIRLVYGNIDLNLAGYLYY